MFKDRKFRGIQKWPREVAVAGRDGCKISGDPTEGSTSAGHAASTRCIVLGMTDGEVLTIVDTDRSERIRIISAWRATKVSSVFAARV
jgi:uncharacterized DUF497 family protein